MVQIVFPELHTAQVSMQGMKSHLMETVTKQPQKLCDQSAFTFIRIALLSESWKQEMRFDAPFRNGNTL